jgi:hypothetical protein
MAERGGFEPPVLIRHSRFPGVRVKPLCHLSNQLIYNYLLWTFRQKAWRSDSAKGYCIAKFSLARRFSRADTYGGVTVKDYSANHRMGQIRKALRSLSFS